MAGATLDNSANIYQIHYGKRLNDQINARTNLWNRIPKHPEKHTGLYRQEYLTTSFPASGGGYGPGATLPQAEVSGDALTNIYHCYLYYPVGIDWDAQYQSDGPANFTDVMTKQMNEVKAFAMLDLERMVAGNGGCVLGQIMAAITVTATGFTCSVPNWTYPRFMESMHCVVYDDDGTSTSGFGEISQTSTKRGVPSSQYYRLESAIYDSAGDGLTLLTFSGVPPVGHGISQYDVIVKHEAVAHGAMGSSQHGSNEIMGLDGVIGATAPPLRTNTKAPKPSSGTFQAIDPTTNGKWRSPSVPMGGAEIDQTWLDRLGENMMQRSAMPPENVKFFLINQVQETILRRNAYSAERYPVTDGAPSLPQGAQSSFTEKKYMQYAGRPLIPSRFFRPDRIKAVGDDIYRYETKEWGFHKPGFGQGSIWHQDFDRRAQDQAEACWYGQIGTTARNKSGELTGAATS